MQKENLRSPSNLCPGVLYEKGRPSWLTRLIVVAFIAVIPVLAQGQGKVPASPGDSLKLNPLSLNKAIELAVKNYPSILARQARVRSSQASIVETRDHRLPSLNLYEQIDGGTSNNLGSAYFSAGIVPSISGVSARPENLGTVSSGNVGVAYLQWLLTNFGGFKAEMNEAYSRLKVDSMDVSREQFYIAFVVLQSYLDLIRNYELSLVQWQNLQRADTIRSAIRNYVLSGLRPGVDSSLAAAEYSKARLNFLDISNQFSQSKVQLSLLTALDTSVIQPDLNNGELLLASITQVPGTDSSFSSHPYLNYYRSIYENGLAREQLIRRSYLPRVYVLGAGWIKGSSINTDGSFDKDLSSGLGYTRSNYLAGVGITYDLFNLRREKDRINVQRFETEAALHTYEQQKQSLANANLHASVDLSTALAKFNEIPIQLGAATDAYRQRLTQYNAGLANIIDLTNALDVLNRAQIDMINTRNGVWRAIVQKAYAGNGIYQLLSTLK
ncbi:MAG: TolC family protein [Bacteroidota bacterium]|nr:TolC family protein [Bacteroidota bacterium]